MGLDTSHDAWHGAYSSFSHWRREVAVAAGIIKDGEYLFPPLKYDEYPAEACPVDWDHWNSITDAEGNWTEEPEDPIWYLLAHSDCEGVIRWEHLIPLADRLEPLIPSVDGYINDFWQVRTRTFIDGLRRAYEAGEDLDFH